MFFVLAQPNLMICFPETGRWKRNSGTVARPKVRTPATPSAIGGIL